jgi:hypothetical protein
MDQDNINPLDTSVPPAPDVSAGEGERNEESGANVANLYEVLNAQLGTNYASDDDALKGMKETRSYVGKLGKYRPLIEQLESTKGEQEALHFMENIINEQPAEVTPEPKVDTEQFVPRSQYEKDTFFSGKSYTAEQFQILEALKATNPDKSWGEVAELPAFKSVIEAQAGEGTSAGLGSSQRINAGTSEDYQKEFEAAKATGNWLPFLEKYKGIKLETQ